MCGKYTHRLLYIGTVALIFVLGSCSNMPTKHDDNSLQREAMAGTGLPPPPPLPLDNNQSSSVVSSAPNLSLGSGKFIRSGTRARSRGAVSENGKVSLNFENQPIQAVVKSILGDVLKKNYTIVQGVQGNISFSTSEPVALKQALPILETLLSWTNNALVFSQGRYVVLPRKQAVAGNLVPGLDVPAPELGLQARLFPLHYISATQMQKLIKPFAKADSILLVDPARNLLVLSGTQEELENYARTISTFDVDWLRGMSVGVFNLQYVNINDIMPALDQMFGTRGSTPLAGMVRLIPIGRTNTLVVISTQPNYVTQVGQWVNKIDKGSGNQSRLYVYNVRNIKASDLAHYLAQIYIKNAGGGDSGGRIGPGLRSRMNWGGGFNGMGSNAGGFGGSFSGGSFDGMPSMMGGNYGPGGRQYTSNDGSIRISSVDSNNQLLVRARPSQWKEIKNAINKLDIVPLQVQIETRIFEVGLTGEFKFGVQWYLQGLAGSRGKPGSKDFVPGHPTRSHQIAIGSGGTSFTGAMPMFYSFLNSRMQVALRALQSSDHTKMLSAPSLVVMNNQPAQILVGDRIPVIQNYYSGGDRPDNTIGEVQYENTGVILNVIPRVNPGGLVYLQVQQQVSQPGHQDKNGNYTIAERKMSTQVVVQSGQTVLLGGLIQQKDHYNKDGLPFLSRIPILGYLFGATDNKRERTELIVLITPRVIRNSHDASQVIEDYRRKFESLQPLRDPPLRRVSKAASRANSARSGTKDARGKSRSSVSSSKKMSIEK